MSGVRMLHFSIHLWKFIQIHQYYIMALIFFLCMTTCYRAFSQTAMLEDKGRWIAQTDLDIQGSHAHHAHTRSSCAWTINRDVHEDTVMHNNVKRCLYKWILISVAFVCFQNDVTWKCSIILSTYLKNICNFLQASLQVFAALHQVLDVVDTGEEDPEQLKELALLWRQVCGRHQFDKIGKVVTTAQDQKTNGG